MALEQADKANQSKSRFLAAASHDLLQPMHAARLFSTALEQSVSSTEDQQTLQQLDRACMVRKAYSLPYWTSHVWRVEPFNQNAKPIHYMTCE